MVAPWETFFHQKSLKIMGFMVGVTCLFYQTPAYAIDVSPGAYIPAPEGKVITMLYLGGGKADSYKPRHGNKIANGTKLTTHNDLLRLFYMSSIAGMRAQYQAAIPYGSQNLRLNGSHIGKTSGFADPFIALTLWPINHPESKEYLGVSGYLYMPIGRYNHNASLNMGSNRYQGAVQIGYSKTWGAWRLDMNGDVSIYGHNDKSGSSEETLKQDPTFVLQPWLSYIFNNGLTASLGVTRTWGGHSELDGVDTYRATDSTRLRAGVGYWVTPQTQLYVELARDVQVNGGYKYDYTGFLRIAYFY